MITMWLKLLFCVLFACGSFMFWDIKRRNRIEAAHRPAPVAAPPRARIKRGPPLLALSLMFLLLALVEVVHPRTPPFAGALGGWLEGVHNVLGPYGIAIVWFTLAGSIASLAWRAWQRDQALSAADAAALRES